VTPTDPVVVLNSGSSSVKFAIARDAASLVANG